MGLYSLVVGSSPGDETPETSQRTKRDLVRLGRHSECGRRLVTSSSRGSTFVEMILMDSVRIT